MIDKASDPLAEITRMKTRKANEFWYFKDKSLMESGAAQEILSKVRLTVEQLQSRRDGEDPPDCEAIIGGQRCGIEVTELLHQPTLEATLESDKDFFFRWDQNDLRAAIQKLINRKDTPAKVKGGPYSRYVLVIFTNEFILTGEIVERFLFGATFHAPGRLITPQGWQSAVRSTGSPRTDTRFSAV